MRRGIVTITVGTFCTVFISCMPRRRRSVVELVLNEENEVRFHMYRVQCKVLRMKMILTAGNVRGDLLHHGSGRILKEREN